MKKYVAALALFLSLWTLLTACQKEPYDSLAGSDTQNESDTQEILVYTPYDEITDDEWERLHEYDRSYDHVDLADKTIVKSYSYAGVTSRPIDEVMSQKNIMNSVVIYNVLEDGVVLDSDRDGALRENTRDFDQISFFADFKYVNSTIDILNTQCFLYEVISFDGSGVHMGTVNYLITDQGVFVKYYSSPIAEALIFTEDEYRSLAATYENFCREDLESERDPTLYGPVYSIQFHDFIKDEALLEKYSKP